VLRVLLFAVKFRTAQRKRRFDSHSDAGFRFRHAAADAAIGSGSDVMSSRWFKNAIIYSLDVETFRDSDGDGIGDFRGLRDNLDYLDGLGVTCLWLLPFYPTPNRDNGYDVTDYYGVDPRLGSLGDFVEFMHAARERGLRVMVDLVLNHTSIEHPWFQAARRGDPRFREFYVWRKEEPPDTSHMAIFPPMQKSIWTYDDAAGAWYLHRFYPWQPDLNISNPAVQYEMEKIMRYWLELGVSGFRLDAAPFLVELHGIRGTGEGEEFDYSYLDEFREFLSWTRGDAVMLAEANVASEKLGEYFGGGHRMHLLFNFLTNQETFLALARHSARPLEESLQHLPEKPAQAQWAYFLRNHDELSLDKLSAEEKEECFREFAPEERMRLFDRGIRRRMAPMLGNERARIELAFSLLFSMPGAPVIWYGEEIGMGDDLSLEERNPVRTPMQWSGEPNGGFSAAAREKLIRPVIDEGVWGYRELNVERQQRDPHSLLNAITRMIQARKKCPEFGLGTWRAIESDGGDAVFAHSCEWEGRVVVALHNLTTEKRAVTIRAGDGRFSELVELLGDGEDYRLTDGRCTVELEPQGYRWFRLRRG
jgi:maltose alpha-D-glucosyltransferase/alpha-amylase